MCACASSQRARAAFAGAERLVRVVPVLRQLRPLETMRPLHQDGDDRRAEGREGEPADERGHADQVGRRRDPVDELPLQDRPEHHPHERRHDEPATEPLCPLVHRRLRISADVSNRSDGRARIPRPHELRPGAKPRAAGRVNRAERQRVFTFALTASTFALSPADRTVSFSERELPGGVVLFAETVIATMRCAPAGIDTKYVPLVTNLVITLPPLVYLMVKPCPVCGPIRKKVSALPESFCSFTKKRFVPPRAIEVALTCFAPLAL